MEEKQIIKKIRKEIGKSGHPVSLKASFYTKQKEMVCKKCSEIFWLWFQKGQGDRHRC